MNDSLVFRSSTVDTRFRTSPIRSGPYAVPAARNARSLPAVAHRLYTWGRRLGPHDLSAADVAFFTNTALLEAVDGIDRAITKTARAIHAGIGTEHVYLIDRLGREGLRYTRSGRERKATALADVTEGPTANEQLVTVRNTFVERWSLAYWWPGRTDVIACQARQAGRLSLEYVLLHEEPPASVSHALRTAYLTSEAYLIGAALESCASHVNLPDRSRSILERATERLRRRPDPETRTDVLNRLRRYRDRVEHVFAAHWDLSTDDLQRSGQAVTAFRTACLRRGSTTKTPYFSTYDFRRYVTRCERETSRLLAAQSPPEASACLSLLLGIPR